MEALLYSEDKSAVNGTREKVSAFITENFLFRSDLQELGDEESLMDAGIIDSAGILELVAFIEGEFGVNMQDADMVRENLNSIAAITRYISRKKGQALHAA